MTTRADRWRSLHGYPLVHPRVAALIRWWAAVLTRRTRPPVGT
jgi:hypothetical protein